jgi:uncharacterized membrane protein YgdD (TMEM256/DUF423 family)
MNKTFLIIGAVLMALGVGLGAFGAHALKQKLSAEMMTVYKTAVEYHFYHALGLILIGILYQLYPSKMVMTSGWVVFLGVILFSGSLYVLSITGIKWIGAITPIGGVAFIAGWVLLVIGIIKYSPQ